jgi:hypothetical protein
VLPLIIHDSQNAFVHNRLMTDNVLLAFGTIHTFHMSAQNDDCFMALKLNMSQVFDRVEWDNL